MVGYDSGWRKHVVSECFEFGASSRGNELCSWADLY